MEHKTAAERQANAKADFKRLLKYTFLVAVLAVAASLSYLKLNDMLTTFTAVIVGIAVFVTFMLGAALMALGFFSSNAGHDETINAQHHPVKIRDGEIKMTSPEE